MDTVYKMAIATLNGCKIKKVDAVKDKVIVIFEGKSDEISSGGGKTLADALKELTSAAYLSLSVSFSVDSAIAPPAPAVEKKQTENK
jgi:hypothetical protein